MNRNNYQLGSDSFELNEKADKLMEVICFLSHERVCAKFFPSYSSINYTDVDEQEFIEAIEDMEKVYKKGVENTKYGFLHHRAHPYYMSHNRVENEYNVYPNNTEYGSDPNFSAPVCSGKTALDALKNAWRMWSIPPVLILNSEYYIHGITINEVVE